ncbi:MAG: pyruvate kinase [bacterium]|nr:pyruvate kinase [bacterium]
MRRSKIICTIGPASKDLQTIKELIQAGMNIARLNASHGDFETLEKIIANIRIAAKSMQKTIGILLDLEGPHVRVGEIAGGHVELHEAQELIITNSLILGNSKYISINYKNIIKDVKAGNNILLDDGNIKLQVLRKSTDGLHCTVLDGGVLKSHKSVNVPGVYLNLPSLTSKDMAYIKFGVRQNVDFFGLSFVRQTQDVIRVKNYVKKLKAKTWVIAKIEHPLAVANIDDIINAADGIMIARGDLGVELPTEDVPIVQKTIIRKCNAFAKPVITATQMLESMIDNQIPTRAEATDVANAIIDGTDAVMLSGETAVGKHPALVVQIMEKIILKAETSMDYDKIFESKKMIRSVSNIPHAVSHATIQAAIDLKASAIITATKSGQTARLISCHRPSAFIYAITTDKDNVRKLNLLWGVIPYHIAKFIRNTDQMIEYSMKVVKRHKRVQFGDTVVITSGAPVGIAGKTNMLEINVIK